MFFFFKQKTAYEMRISDWSSDVCSSDLESSRQAELGPNDFDLIVSDDSPDLRLNPRMWPTLACRIRPPDDGWEHQRHLLQVQMDGNVFGDEIVQTLLQSTGADSW